MEVGQEELLERVRSADFENKYSNYTFGLMYRVNQYLHKIDKSRESERYLLNQDEEELDQLYQCVDKLQDIMFSPIRIRMVDDGRTSYESQDIVDSIMRELNDKTEASRHDDIIAEENGEVVKNWIEANKTISGAWADSTDENGRDFQSLAIVLEEMKRDVGAVDSLTDGTKMAGGASFPPIKRQLIGLVITGIFLPLMFLFTIPKDVTENVISYLSFTPYIDWLVLLTQLVVLMTTGYLTLNLLNRMMREMS